MNMGQSLLHDRVIILGRYPLPGQAKTRLIPVVGPARAADLQRQLTEKIFKTVSSVASRRCTGVEFRFEGGSKRKMRQWLGSNTIFSPQSTGNLGDRMRTAFFKAFENGNRRVVLLGTDIPELRSDHLGQAFDALIEHDLVVGPSTDGGYWLIGLKRPMDLFQAINWGTNTVFEQTIALAKNRGLRIHRLDPLTDIDTEEDLKLWRPEEIRPQPFISVIIPTLNESANIEATIRRTQNEEVEIIVVDGGSTDKTVEKAIRAGTQVIKSPRSRAIQQNMGARIARGRVLLFLHADTLLPKNYVNQIFEVLMDPRTAAGAFRFKANLNNPLMKLIELMTNIRSRHLQLPYGDQGLFIRKSLFDSVGGFPEVPIAEDLFFVRRILNHGRIRIAKEFAVTSARRWRMLGPLRTTIINQLILAGCYLGVSPAKLAPLYRIPFKK